MDILGMLGSAVGSVLTGGITGLAGTAITAFVELKKQKLENTREEKKYGHELDLQSLDNEAMKEEWNQRIKVAGVEADKATAIATTEAESAREIADAELMKVSLLSDKATYATGDKAKNSILFIVVDFIRGTIRPALTYTSVGMMIYLTIKLFAVAEGLNESLAVDYVQGLLHQVISVVLYVGTTCILWWFGTRNKIFKNMIK